MTNGLQHMAYPYARRIRNAAFYRKIRNAILRRRVCNVIICKMNYNAIVCASDHCATFCRSNRNVLYPFAKGLQDNHLNHNATPCISNCNMILCKKICDVIHINLQLSNGLPLFEDKYFEHSYPSWRDTLIEHSYPSWTNTLFEHSYPFWKRNITPGNKSLI